MRANPTDEIALTDKQLFARLYRLLSEMRADSEMVLGPHPEITWQANRIRDLKTLEREVGARAACPSCYSRTRRLGNCEGPPNCEGSDG